LLHSGKRNQPKYNGNNKKNDKQHSIVNKKSR
jgi:hypothetical protein